MVGFRTAIHGGVILVAVFVVHVAYAGFARAQIDASTELEYEATPETRCMSSDELHAELAARLGRDPVREGAERTIQVQVTREGRELVARISMREGRSSAQRELRTLGRSCRELSEDLLLTLTLLIDTPPAAESEEVEEVEQVALPEPVREPIPERPAPQEVPEPVREPALEDPNVDEPVVEEPTLRLRIHLGALVALGALPKAGWGAEGALSLTFDALALTLGARYVGTPALEFTPGEVSSSLVQARAMFSYRFAGFEAGVVVGMGAFIASGSGYDTNESVTRLSLAVGGLGSFTLQVTPTIGVRLFVELLGSAVGTNIQVGDVVVWRSPALSGALGLAFVWGR